MGLDFVELVMRTEEVFPVELPAHECELIETVGDLYGLILKKMELPYVASGEIQARSVGRVRPMNEAGRLSPWTSPDVWLTLRELIHQELGVDDSQISESASFVDDLRCD